MTSNYIPAGNSLRVKLTPCACACAVHSLEGGDVGGGGGVADPSYNPFQNSLVKSSLQFVENCY